MAAVTRVAGVTKITLDGLSYRVQGSVEIMPLDFAATEVLGADGLHGYKEEPRAPSMKFDITVGPEVSVRGLQTVRNSTLVAEGPTGAVWILANAFFSGEAAYNPVDGKLSVEFKGSSCREVGA